jgi:hypothetical protein
MTMAKMSPLGMVAGGLADRFLPKDFNLTESVGNGLSAVGNGISNVAGAVGNGISNAAGAVGSGLSSAYNFVTSW